MSKKAKILVRNEFSGTKLAELLRALTKEEYKRLGLFMRSPLFNKSRKLIKLYEYFKKKREKIDSSGITKENISESIYPGESYNDQNLRKLISNFTGSIEEYLILIEAEKDKAWKANILLTLSHKRGLEKSFKQASRDLEDIYENITEKNTEYYLNYLNTQRIVFDHRSNMLKSPEEKISELSKSLDMYYLSLKLLDYYDILNLKLHYNKNVEFDMWAFDEIVRFIDRNKDEMRDTHCSVYADYLSVLMLLNPSDAKNYVNLRNYVKEKSSEMAGAVLHRLYIYLYNHSIYRVNRGFTENNSELLDIIKIIDAENIPIWNYFAFHIYYVNAVTNAARAGEFKWAEGFITRRKDMINADIREETNSLAMANLNFTKRDYDSALKYLVNVDYPNYSYYLMAKDMLIKIYWERSEAEGVLSAVEAMRKFLQRKDLIPERMRETYTNFINCAAKMVDPHEKNRMFEIKKLLEKEMISADKTWIEDQLKRIEISEK